MVVVYFGAPLILLVSCGWALAPIHNLRHRVWALGSLLVAAGIFVAAWQVRGHGHGAAALVAPAALLAALRLMIDLFTAVERRRLCGAAPIDPKCDA